MSKKNEHKFKKMKLEFDFRLISKDNEKIANKQGRFFLSKRFKDWANQVAVSAFAQCGKPLLTDTLAVNIKAYFTNKTHSDCMNLSKGLLDALQNIVYLNDRQIKKGTVEVFEGYPEDSFTVEITPYKSI